MKRIIFATGNKDKMREIREIMGDLPVEILSRKEAGLAGEAEEDGESFQENAVIKAKYCRSILQDDRENTIIMADDSGLVIDALNGEPGIYSARYMGEDTSYRLKNANLIGRLSGVPEEKRTARFVCAIAAVLPDETVLTAVGTIEGKIGYEERGKNGFGYDPIFYLPDMSCSTAELPPEEKNKISHRGNALRAMRKQLEKYFE